MTNTPATSAENVTSHQSIKERRQRERLKIDVPVHVQPVYPEREELAEVTKTIDFNQNGLCFVGLLNHYEVGLVIFVTLPFYPGTSVRRRVVGEVVRIERLASGGQGVAVKFLS